MYNQDQLFLTLSVYSLKERSMQIVRKTFHRRDIPDLGLPQTLQRELLASVT